MAGDVMQALRDLVTTADGVTHDLGRWSWVASFAAVVLDAIGLAAGVKLPSVTELATALVAVAAGHAGALFFKRDTEPKESP
jgi:hypothetical protein